jgi:O-antigen/teichoic acid export membrane protein
MPRLLSHAHLPLHRNAYALVASAGSTAALGLIYWSVAARTYNAAAMGTQSAILSAMILLAGLGEVGADTLLIRFLPTARGDARRLLIRTYAVTATIAAVTAIVFVIGTNVWSPPLSFMRTSPWWFVAFVLATAATCIFALQDSVLTGIRRAIWVPIENGLASVAKIVLLILFAKLLVNEGIFASWNVPSLLAVVLVNLLVFRRFLVGQGEGVQAGPTLPHPTFLVRYALGNYVGSLFALAMIYVMPLLVIYRLGADATAYFFIPWTIYNGLQFIATKISYSLIVEVVADPPKLRSYFRRSLAHMFAMIVPLSLVLVVFGEYILRLFGSQYSSNGSDLLRWLAAAAVPAAVVPLSITLARLRNQAGLVALIQGGSCLLLLGMSYVLLGHFGITGVGIAAFASSVIVAAFLAWNTLWPVLAPAVRAVE